MKFTVKVWATDWCGYDSSYEIAAADEGEAVEKALEEFIQEWDIILFEDGMYGETDEFDEEGYPHDEDTLTSIGTQIED